MTIISILLENTNCHKYPYEFLLVNPENYLKKNQKYYIYCEYGTRSEKLCNKLSNLGYDVVNVIGGYNEYKLSNHRT